MQQENSIAKNSMKNFISGRVARTAGSLARFFSNDLHLQLTLEEISQERDIKIKHERDTYLLIGRIAGQRILDNNDREIQEKNNQIINGLPPDISFKEMGFDDEQIASLDSRIYFPSSIDQSY